MIQVAKRALMALMVMAGSVSAQTGLSANTEIGPLGAGNYTVTYFGSGGASYWHSLWAVPVNQGVAATASASQLVCKDTSTCPGVSNPFSVDANYTTQFTTSSDWVFGLLVNPNGVSNSTGQFWLFSLNALNQYPESGYLHSFANGNVLQDDRTTVMVNTVDTPVIGWEDIARGGDRDFNDFVFQYETIDNPSEIVPEPATMTLLATGLVGLAASRRKKKNSV